MKAVNILRTWFMLGLAILLITACTNNDTTSSKQSSIGKSTVFSVPGAIQAAQLPVGGKLIASIYMDGKLKEKKDVTGANSVRFELSGIPVGKHSFSIRFDFDDMTYGMLPLAVSVNKSVDVTSGGTHGLDFVDEPQHTDFTFPDYDSDTYDNLTELEHNSNPKDASSVPDLIPPVINNIIVNPQSNSVAISWETDEPANSVVNYGLDASYGSTESDNSLVYGHNITIFGLLPNTTYHYEISSSDGSDNTSSTTDATFTTQAAGTAGVTISESDGSTKVREDGNSDTYTLVLDRAPTDDVSITITTDTQTTVDPGITTFNSSNWNTPQTITVYAASDILVEGAHTSTITHAASSNDSSYNGITIADIVVNVTDPLPAGSRVVFATSVTGNGNLNSWADAGVYTGLAAADAICQARASAAGLAGNFKPWLSDDSNDAYCRIHGYNGTKAANCGQPSLPVTAGPWLRIDGFPWGGRIDQVLSPNYVILVPVLYDEFGDVAESPQFSTYTATDVNGVASGTNCLNWTDGTASQTGNGGYTLGIADSFTAIWGGLCSSDYRRLLCMQTGPGAALPVPAATGKKVFLTSTTGTGDLGSWAEAGGNVGLAAADAICNVRAASAGFTGSFKAWISDSTTDAKDRLTSDGPWVKLDGVMIAKNKADLIDGTIFTGINMTENYVYTAYQRAWTSTDESGIKVTDTCNDWTDGTSGSAAMQGVASQTGDLWSNWNSYSCNGNYHLYCFED